MNVSITGNPDGRTVFFLAGWPDTWEIFRDNIMLTLASQYRLVGLTLPGFDRHSPILNSTSKAQKFSTSKKNNNNNNNKNNKSSSSSVHLEPIALSVPRLGYSFEEIVDLFEIAVLAAMENRPFEQPMLIAHDWGCVIAYEFLLLRPFFFARIVMLDVGGPVNDGSYEIISHGNNNNNNNKSNKIGINISMWWDQYGGFLCIVFYQFIIIAAFLFLPTFIGKKVLRMMLHAANRPSYKYAYTSFQIKENNNINNDENGLERILVPSYVQKKQNISPKSFTTRFINFLKSIIFDNTENIKVSSNEITAAFHPGKFYYARGTPAHTLPPQPGSIGIYYTSYNCVSSSSLHSPTITKSNIIKGNSGVSSGNTFEYNSFINEKQRQGFSNNSSSSSSSSNSNIENTATIVDIDPELGWIYLRYWILWVSRLLPTSQRFLIPISVPVMFMYGTEKPVMFHSQSWVKHIEEKGQRDGSEVMAVAGGHWFFAEHKNKKKVSERIAEFLDASQYESLVG